MRAIFIGFLISYLGSLPLGVLNLSVVGITVRQGLYAAFLFSIGVIGVEFFQAFVAVWFSQYLLAYPGLEQYVQLLAIPIFLILGAFYFFKKQAAENEMKTLSGFKEGIVLSLLNPLAIPFWLFYSVYIGQKGWLTFSQVEIFSFAFGVSQGTLAALMSFAFLSNLIKNQLQFLNKWIDKIIGSVFLLMGFYQIYAYCF